MASLPAVALLAALAALVAAPAAVDASCCSGMTMNAAGLALTESSEGYVDHVYNDATGHPTCCYGHLVRAGETFPNPIPHSTCVQLLQEDLGSAESCVRERVNVPLNSNQFSALVDFTYNLGCGTLGSSTLLSELNQGNYAAVPAQMARFVYSSGQELPGLVTRRAKEGDLWNTPVSGGSGSGGSHSGGSGGSHSGGSGGSGSGGSGSGGSGSGGSGTTNAPDTEAPTDDSSGDSGDDTSAQAANRGSSSSAAIPAYGAALIALTCVVVVAAIGLALYVKRARTTAAADPLQDQLLASTNA